MGRQRQYEAYYEESPHGDGVWVLLVGRGSEAEAWQVERCMNLEDMAAARSLVKGIIAEHKGILREWLPWAAPEGVRRNRDLTLRETCRRWKRQAGGAGKKGLVG